MAVPPRCEATLCFAVAERPSAAPLHGVDRLLVLDGLTDAQNVGALVPLGTALESSAPRARRVAAAFQAAVLLSSDCCDAFQQRAIRASGGHVFQVPLLTAELPQVLQELRRRGVWLMAAIVQEASFLDEAQSRERAT